MCKRNMFHRSACALISNWVIGMSVLLTASLYPGSMNQPDERIIRNMVNQAVDRLNKGDVTAIAEFWDEDADYVGVDGKLTKGRAQIQALFSGMAKASLGQQTASIDQIRFITPELATVDGSWTVTGARGADAKELPVIHGRGFELVQKKDGRWRFISTREMVVFRDS